VLDVEGNSLRSVTVLDVHGLSFELWLVGYCLGHTAYAHMYRWVGFANIEDMPEVALQYVLGFTKEGKEAVRRGLTTVMPSRPETSRVHSDAGMNKM
jgi:hypothetical protein